VTYVKLDDGFFANPKIAAVGYDGAGLYAMGLSYCGKYLTDGFLPSLWANQHPKRIITKLEHGGLWRPVEGGFVMTDYLDYNRCAADIKEERRRKREAGKRGAEARWDKQDPEAQAIRDAIANAIPSAIGDVVASRDAPDQTRPYQGSPEVHSQSPEQIVVVAASTGLEDKSHPILAVIDQQDPNTLPLIEELCAQLPTHTIRYVALEVERAQNVRKSKTAIAVRLLQKAVDKAAA
jgi:hypothetical protein